MPEDKKDQQDNPDQGGQPDAQKKAPEGDSQKETPTSEKPTESPGTDYKSQYEKQSERLKDLEKEREELLTIANVVAANPDLRKSFQEVYSGKTGDDGGDASPGGKDASPEVTDAYKTLGDKVDSIESSQRTKLIDEFEREVGISNMDTEAKTLARQQVETKLKQWGHSAKNTPLDSLTGLMKDAFSAAYTPQIIQNAIKEGAAKGRTNSVAALAGLTSVRTDPDEDEGLTSGQAEWAKRLQVDPEKAARRKKEISAE